MTNPLITEARRLRAAVDPRSLKRILSTLKSAGDSDEAALIAFAANNILAFADKIEELQASLDDANGQLGEFFNTPSGAIIKKLEQELSDEKAVVAILTAMNASSKSTQEWMNLEFQNTKLCEACEAAAGWMAKFSETGSKYDSDEVRTQLRAALEPK